LVLAAAAGQARLLRLLKPSLARGAYPQRQSRCPLQTVLGGFSERQTPCLKTRTTTDLTKLLHEPLSFATTQKHDLPKCSLFKDQRPIENYHAELKT
jgi:hypothetical protein